MIYIYREQFWEKSSDTKVFKSNKEIVWLDKSSFFSKRFYLLDWRNLIFQFSNELSAQEQKFPLKFEFWRTFSFAQPYKSAPKFKFQRKFLFLGRKFVAELEDEFSSVQKLKSFREKATFKKYQKFNFLLIYFESQFAWKDFHYRRSTQTPRTQNLLLILLVLVCYLAL